MEEACTDIVQGKFQFYGRLKKCIEHLNGFFVQIKMPVVGLKGMGGEGKTVLPHILRSEHRIKGYLGNNSIFIPLSQLPNLLRIQRLYGIGLRKKMQKFQNLEDWHMLQPILMQPYETLVILDDVWSRTNLEYLLFEGPGRRIPITEKVALFSEACLLNFIHCHSFAERMRCHFSAFGLLQRH